MSTIKTTKIVPGDDMHLNCLMAPHGLNFVMGEDRQHLLAFGRAAFTAGQQAGAFPFYEDVGPVVVYQMKDGQDTEYNTSDTFSGSRKGGTPLVSQVSARAACASRDAVIAGLRKEVANAKALVVDVYAMLPEQAIAARHELDKRAGPWFVFGVDRNAQAAQS
ncbi:MAG: hypothetical protein JWR74_2142 [Polaromonas sp.]|nr:hypothetical protein [Polaromonas sp.]